MSSNQLEMVRCGVLSDEDLKAVQDSNIKATVQVTGLREKMAAEIIHLKKENHTLNCRVILLEALLAKHDEDRRQGHAK